jgi:hypothetical protein
MMLALQLEYVAWHTAVRDDAMMRCSLTLRVLIHCSSRV